MTANDRGHLNQLDDKQKAKLKEFWSIVIENLTDEAMNDRSRKINREELFLTIGNDHPDSVVLRWIRARKWNIELAFEQFYRTILWRSKPNVKRVLTEGEFCLSIAEVSTGKTCYVGFDKLNRPINYVSVKKHVRSEFPLESTEALTIFAMETGRQLLRYPVETVTVIFDMTDFSLRNMDYQHVKFIVDLLENHYPESLGVALIVNAPWIFNSCWLLIRSWLDPVVQSKIHFIKNMDQLSEFIDRSYLPKHLNGDLKPFSFVPATDEDRQLFDTMKTHVQQSKKFKDEHNTSIDRFIEVTYRWTRSPNEDSSVDEQRSNAIDELRRAFERRIPFCRTRNHYHRTGLIDDSPFENLLRQKSDEQTSTEF